MILNSVGGAVLRTRHRVIPISNWLLVMSDNSHTQPRALMPRRLEQQETLNLLNKWKSVFRNYYRRCPYYGLFLLPSTVWDSSNTRGFSAPEPTGLKRDVQTLAADLDGFLDCIASYCPFDYVGDKLKSESVNLQTVWEVFMKYMTLS